MGDSEIHPLLNHLVLQKIFFQGSPWVFQDIHNLRLVCKAWWSVTLDLWRGEVATLTLLSYGNPPSTTECIGAGVPVNQFLNVLKKSMGGDDLQHLKSKPFRRYKLHKWDITQYYDLNIWDTLGPLMEHLHLDRCTFHDFGEGFRNIVFERTPNLKGVVITENELKKDGESLGSDLYWWDRLVFTESLNQVRSTEKIVSFELTGDFPLEFNWSVESLLLWNCPKLKKLRIWTKRDHPWKPDSSETQPPKCKLLEHWATMIENVDHDTFPFPKIEQLDMMRRNLLPVTLEDVANLRSLRFPLKILCIQPHLNFCSENEIHLLLQSHRDTLEILKIFRQPFQEPLQSYLSFKNLGLCGMPKMREVHLWGNVFSSISFLPTMGNLRLLYINFTCFQKWEEMKCNLEKYSVLRVSGNDMILQSFTTQTTVAAALTTLHIDCHLSSQSLKTLGNCMPGLKVLQTILNNETLRIVTDEIWPKLEELTLLFGSDVDDDSIIGIVKHNEKSTLAKFTYQSFCSQSKLTDLSAIGFLLLKFLHTLNICVSDRFSLEAEESLKSKIFQVRIVRNYGDSHSQSGFECCSRVQFRKETHQKIII